VHIALGADHAGFQTKNELAHWLRSLGHEVLDLGAATLDPDDDYPDFAEAVTEAVAVGRAERGLLLCGSGVGASITANKVPGIRAGLCHDTYSAHQGVEHDDMNVLCVGTRVIGPELAREIILAFVGATFSGEERHLRRLSKLKAVESRYTSPASNDA
jgi:ribose 5-phosphate isomerase B